MYSAIILFSVFNSMMTFIPIPKRVCGELNFVFSSPMQKIIRRNLVLLEIYAFVTTIGSETSRIFIAACIDRVTPNSRTQNPETSHHTRSLKDDIGKIAYTEYKYTVHADKSTKRNVRMVQRGKN